MKILILGGTGPMGVYLTEILRERASEIVVTSRSAQAAVGNVHFIQGNAKDTAFMKSLLEQRWDAIIDFMVYTTSEFKSRLDSLLGATEQYFYLSSARVYADSEEPLTENSPRLLDVSPDEVYLSTDEYALAKARQENFLFGHSKKNWTIIRPYITYGPERLQLGVLEKEAWLYRALQGRSIVFTHDMAKRTTTITHGQDVARAMAALVGEGGALGEVFHITGPHCETWQTILEIYRAILSQHGRTVPVKNLDLATFDRCHGGHYQVVYDRLYDRIFNNSKINQYLDTSTFCTIDQGLTACLTEFLNNPKFYPINWALEGAKDRAAGEVVDLAELGKLTKILKYVKYRFLL